MEKGKLNFLKKNLVVLIMILLTCSIFVGCGNTTESIAVDSIEISKKNLYLAEGQTAVISAQVYPFNASNQNYIFESDNPNIVTIEDGFVVAKKAGDAVISVISEEGGYKDTCNVLVTRVSENLALNKYNNLNMPPKELEPIYNSNDYSTAISKNVNALKPDFLKSKKLNPLGIKKISNKQTEKSDKNNFFFKKQNDTIKKTFKQKLKDIALNVNAEISEDISQGKEVLENLKQELSNSIQDLQNRKEALSQNIANTTFPSFENSFLQIQNDMIDMFSILKQDMINEIDNVKEKIDNGEYITESKNINGVTFVCIKSKPQATENVVTED